MAGLRRPTGRDKNPLRRPLDRTRERLAWAMMPAAVLAVALAAVSAGWLYGSEQRAAAQVAPHRHRVAATVLAAASETHAWPGNTVPTLARWHYPTGRIHTSHVPVPAGTRSGATVTVWVDDVGRRATAPRTTSDIVSNAIATGLAVLLGTALVTGCAYATARRRNDARAAAAWGHEWAQVEPRWSGRYRSV